ncbi:hypothetical protein ACC680_28310 [Rhizobium ruizarguesonis]
MRKSALHLAGRRTTAILPGMETKTWKSRFESNCGNCYDPVGGREPMLFFARGVSHVNRLIDGKSAGGDECE